MNTLSNSEEELLNSQPLKVKYKWRRESEILWKNNKGKKSSRFSSIACNDTLYKTELDLTIINFVKGLISEAPLLNLHRVGLSKYRDIVDYLKIFKPSLKLTENPVWSLKKRSIKVKSVPKSKKVLSLYLM